LRLHQARRTAIANEPDIINAVKITQSPCGGTSRPRQRDRLPACLEGKLREQVIRPLHAHKTGVGHTLHIDIHTNTSSPQAAVRSSIRGVDEHQPSWRSRATTGSSVYSYASLKLVAVCFAHGHGVYRIYTDSDPVFKALRAALRQWASYSKPSQPYRSAPCFAL
jgi:hypothetical protein